MYGLVAKIYVINLRAFYRCKESYFDPIFERVLQPILILYRSSLSTAILHTELHSFRGLARIYDITTY
jgi:hypothetical protein